MGKPHTPDTAACDVEALLNLIEGRWKLLLLFHLLDGKVQRYSDLERLIPAISQRCWPNSCASLNATAWYYAPSTRRYRRRWTTASRPGARPCAPHWMQCSLGARRGSCCTNPRRSDGFAHCCGPPALKHQAHSTAHMAR